MMKTDASLYIIGHEHFNKSLTLDVENRLMHYLMSVDKVHQVHNGRGNPQKHYYPSEEFEGIFQKIWTELHESDEELFPDENIVKDSAIYKASPLHKLTDEQEDAKIQILDCIALTRNKNEKQIIFIDGEAGTGKTVLNSSIFYELYCQEEEKDNTEFKCCMVVNHDEQVKVYSDIAKKLGITEKYKDVVSKASTFLNRHEDPDSVDVVFIDEAHLLFTQGNQGYSGKNQLDDIVKRAKVVAIVFDENQILRMDQYWEKQMIDRYRNKAIEQHNHITLTKQLRIPDIDVLNDVNIFKGIVNAFGIEWKMVEKSYNTINANLHSRKEKIVRTDFKNTVLEILDNSDTTTLSNKEIKDITVSLKIESKWETLKKSGISALPSGDATQAFDELNEILKQAGIFIVPVGELECFVKQVGGHGPDWTNKVLEKYPDLSDRVYDEIKNFIKIVCNL